MSGTKPNAPRSVAVRFDPSAGASPFRLGPDQPGLADFNRFLDCKALLGLSSKTSRTYAYALLRIYQWLTARALQLHHLTDAHLFDYILYRRQRPDKKGCAPRSINLDLTVLTDLYRSVTMQALPSAPGTVRSARSIFARPHHRGAARRRSRQRVKIPSEIITPLTRSDVARFFASLRTWRDLALTSFMLFSGLRSRELLALRLEDVQPDQVLVRGKGNKQRWVPLAPETRQALDSYLRLERPATAGASLFVVLKPPRRGQPLSAAGLRAIFRYHRCRSHLPHANPHRFRHTFATDMIRAGLPLTILMRLMGHSNIEMTLRYVNLSAEDVRAEFLAAIRKRAKN
ncbi:MAG: tyrosine-type recombinase/integrase [Planctomycetota bacterium]